MSRAARFTQRAGVVVALEQDHRAAGHARVHLQRQLERRRPAARACTPPPTSWSGSTDTSMQPSPSHFAMRTPKSVATVRTAPRNSGEHPHRLVVAVLVAERREAGEVDEREPPVDSHAWPVSHSDAPLDREPEQELDYVFTARTSEEVRMQVDAILRARPRRIRSCGRDDRARMRRSRWPRSAWRRCASAVSS